MNPLVSVIIPTANRPQYLPRAVESALAGMAPGEVEVIVVPNGPDQSWRNALALFQDHHAVRVIPVEEANANVARNTGLAAAQGDFVRFLDDDDYLIPEGAVKQYELMRTSGADLVSGTVNLVDAAGNVFDVWRQPDVDDLCVAVLGPWRRCLPTAHVYRHSAISGAVWNPETEVRQDLEWLFDICSSRDLKWARTDTLVGVWRHHWGDRISSSKKFNDIRKLTIPMLLKACSRLDHRGQLCYERKAAIAKGMWSCVHAAFFLEPSYWSGVARKTMIIAPMVRPEVAFYHFPVTRGIDPLVLQWVMLPKRWLFWRYRQFSRKLKIKHYW
ncbi:glycosyltransferase family 2 protein [Thiocapsa marina]|uniref:Glycosyl transferase family 2 n=1 Tax=Thiocapsa marina 5811 TaxID=768671 RepID=F9UEX8_9GAMM|nr:glycosyltransferase family 2 protein [Thiocapsa marina]EGV17449.1 glycosyl transferase family 2 [Thiocapsa marina 5811]